MFLGRNLLLSTIIIFVIGFYITSCISFGYASRDTGSYGSQIVSSLEVGTLLAKEEQLIINGFKHPYQAQAIVIAEAFPLITLEMMFIKIDPNIYTELPFAGGHVLVFR